MLGGVDTSGSVLGSGGGGSSSGGRDGTASEAAATAAVTAMVGSNGNNNNNSNNNSGEEGRVDELGERSFGGNRWPRQETLALLKIRSDMDATFRDASVKGPLWEEVSRKLAELGYHRSAKKCREKFENVYKYHKRTKDGRTGKKSDGKTYRFFDQLEALLNHTSIQSPPPQLKPQAPPANYSHVTVPSTTLASELPLNTAVPPTNINMAAPTAAAAPNFCSVSADLLMSNYSTSSSTSSDLELEGGRRKRKRKWKDFFERLTKEMTRKQEDMQRKFLEAIEKREHERTVREEAWRMQEMTRLNREREILAQERSIAAAKDAAVMAFLEKLSDNQDQHHHHNPNIPPPSTTQQQPQPQPPPPPPQQAASDPVPLVPQPPAVVKLDVVSKSTDNGGGDNQSYGGGGGISSSRWPKVEVFALIRLRTELDIKYQDSGPKGPLWEEISAEMKKLGYNRNAKRCKEKWENINKYFKKVKESNKKRPQDSKTCPYFHQLEALHRQKNTINNNIQLKPEINSVPLMVRPEQQWPPAAPYQHELEEEEEDLESEQNIQDGVVGDDDDDDDDAGDGAFEIVASKPVSMRTGE